MQTADRTYTIDEFWELAQQPEYANKQLELIDGRLSVMSPSSGRNSELAMKIAIPLGQFVYENGLGRMAGADGGFQLDENTLRVPGVAFISEERVPEGEFIFYPAAPDLAVEIIAPSESAKAVNAKNHAYLRAGTRIVWNVYPDVVDVITMAEDGALITPCLTPRTHSPAAMCCPVSACRLRRFLCESICRSPQ